MPHVPTCAVQGAPRVLVELARLNRSVTPTGLPDPIHRRVALREPGSSVAQSGCHRTAAPGAVDRWNEATTSPAKWPAPAVLGWPAPSGNVFVLAMASVSAIVMGQEPPVEPLTRSATRASARFMLRTTRG